MAEGLKIEGSFSRYRVVSKIGEGGMGEVYLAEDTELGRQVALKVLLSEVAGDEDRVRRFVQEAKAASALNHPNILTVYEIGTFEDSRFIATELIKGETLRDRLRGDPLTLREVLDVAMQAAAALNAAHSAGIVHRDIKPENIMLRDDDLVKVLDFGLAKLSEPPASAGGQGASEDATRAQVNTKPGVVMGTVAYMAPEQARGKETDARCDIWSLGVVMYEMLTKRTPFAGETANDSIAAILTKDPPPLDAATPSELQRIIRKTLQKNADERYQTVKDLLLDVKNLRRELEISDELERSQMPHASGSANVSTQVVEKTTNELLATQMLSTAMSAETSVEIARVKKNYRRGIFAVIGISLLAGLGYLGYKYVSPTKQIESIAVMPFVNESGNADIEYLSDGMTETLIKSLSNLPNMDVKPRTTVFRYKGKDTDVLTIGKELNVQAILNGRVVQRGDQLTLSLELVDVQKNRVIWSEQYQRKQSDLVSLQSEIAKDVSTKLTPKLSGEDATKVTKAATTDPDAYQAYLKGRYYWGRRTAENLKKAIEQFKIATDRDPNYALAFVGLADCYALLNEYAGVPVTEAAPQAKTYAERAIAIDESLAEPHATLGLINTQLWQWAEAEKDFKRAIKLNPNYATAYHWYSILLLSLGRYDESLAMIQRAHELDPMSSIITTTTAWVQQSRNDHQASIESMLKLIELDPNFGLAYDILGSSYLKTGRNAEAVDAFEKAAQLSHRYGSVLANLGYVYAATGKRTEALAIIKELEEKYTRKEAKGLLLAAVYAGLGDKDKAFEWLEKDFQNREPILITMRVAIPLESLRDDPRFKDLLKRMNLAE